mmetsp:Transcript_21191/g.45479  ORF Transcript_21191/g.45479 Transcript_21191/m.45479 type:complete len:90 (+) Transcript_21191:39-308(+)
MAPKKADATKKPAKKAGGAPSKLQKAAKSLLDEDGKPLQRSVASMFGARVQVGLPSEKPTADKMADLHRWTYTGADEEQAPQKQKIWGG